MMKLALLITALLALVCSNKALKCYTCKTPEYESSDSRFNKLRLCDKDIEKSEYADVSTVDFAVCKKLIEKIRVSDKEEKLIIRTYETKNQPLQLNKTIFEEYDCKTDLCNTGARSTSVWLTLLLSIPAVISLNI